MLLILCLEMYVCVCCSPQASIGLAVPSFVPRLHLTCEAPSLLGGTNGFSKSRMYHTGKDGYVVGE